MTISKCACVDIDETVTKSCGNVYVDMGLPEDAPDQALSAGLKAGVAICHGASVAGGWWHDLNTGERLQRNKGELLMLIVSEVSEAMEAERKGLMDDKLPHRPGAEVELADAVIRICDYCGAHGYDLAGAVLEKLAYNRKREDHKPENRRKAGGKAF